MKSSKRAKFNAALEEVAAELTAMSESELMGILDSRPLGDVGEFYMAMHEVPLEAQGMPVAEPSYTISISIPDMGTSIATTTYTVGSAITGFVYPNFASDFGIQFDNQAIVVDRTLPTSKRFDTDDGDEGSEAA